MHIDICELKMEIKHSGRHSKYYKILNGSTVNMVKLNSIIQLQRNDVPLTYVVQRNDDLQSCRFAKLPNQVLMAPQLENQSAVTVSCSCTLMFC